MTSQIYLSLVMILVYLAVGVILVDMLGAFAYLGASSRLHAGMLLCILQAPVQFFESVPQGRIINRLSRDLRSLDSELPRSLNVFIWCALMTLSTVAVISFNTPIILVPCLPLLLYYYVLQVPPLGLDRVFCMGTGNFITNHLLSVSGKGDTYWFLPTFR